jgi:hypothetical protein
MFGFGLIQEKKLMKKAVYSFIEPIANEVYFIVFCGMMGWCES